MKFIVTTTISSPTKALKAFADFNEWKLIVVGDLTTPHKEYEDLNCIYLHPEEQKDKYRALSSAIGWKSIQRRNIGFVEAYRLGAEVIATVDDDNVPYADWGKNLLVGQEVECDLYQPMIGVFDPLSVTSAKDVWHRGFPIEYLSQRHKVEYLGKVKRRVLVQADLWDGDPDIDAIARITLSPNVKFSDVKSPYGSNKISPFNSQNTFLAREVIPFYSVLPHIGRMDDIWGSYILQLKFPNSVIYNRASVYQERNPQDLLTNLENEMFGYRNTFKLLDNLENYRRYLPKETLTFLEAYQDCFSI